MTTPAKPERMTEERFAELDAPSRIAGIGKLYNEMRAEARRSRSEEERLSSQVEALWDLIDVLAQAHGHAIGRWLGYREAARRLRRLHTYGVVPCAYRDWESQPIALRDVDAVIREHVATCPKHPIRAVEAERDELARANASLARERDLAIDAHHTATAERATLERERDEALVAYAQAKLDTSDTARELAAAREEAERLHSVVDLQQSYLHRIWANVNGALAHSEGRPTLRAYLDAAVTLLGDITPLGDIDHADE